MIDLHTHFLPSVDDGAKSVKESLYMLSDSFSQGVNYCVATPHCVVHRDADIDSFLERRSNSAAILNQEIQRFDKPYPDIFLGAEVYMDNDLHSYSGIEKLCIKNTPYMLIEFPHKQIDKRTNEWLYSLILMGIKPVIAHIDRYYEWETAMLDFDGLDIVYQINASQFLSFLGRQLAKKLIKKKKTYVVSSDMHNMSSRASNMKSAYKKAQRMYPQLCDDLFFKNAKAILDI